MPYRIPAELPGDLGDAEVPAPTTWRRQSSRVLGALARLNEARGASETAGALEDRARRAREEEPSPRQLPRCTAAFEAFAAGDFDRAREKLESWLDDAHVLASSPYDRLEAHLGLAAIANATRTDHRADAHLREVMSCGAFQLRASTPLGFVLPAARAWIALGRPEAADVLLDDRRERDGTLQRLRSEIALANDELARAQILAGESLELHAAARGVDSGGHAETRVLIARIHLRAGRKEAAARVLSLAIDSFECAFPRAPIAEAEAWGWAATFLVDKGDRKRARIALERGSALLRHLPVPCLSMVGFLSLGARVLHAAGESELASAWDGAVAKARAGFPASR